MARFFNPVIGLSGSSTGAGKTFLLRRIRVRTIADTLDCLYRFGGEFFFPGLVEVNLSVANMPIICISQPQISGLVAVDRDGIDVLPAAAGSLDEVEAFIAGLDNNIRVLGKIGAGNPNATSSIIQSITGGSFVTTWRDGIRRNVSEITDAFFNGVTSDSVWAAYRVNGETAFYFAVTPYNFTKEFPGADPVLRAEQYVRIHCVMRDPTVVFNGTGVPRHVTMEGLNFPVVGGSVIDHTVDNNKWAVNAYAFARYISDADADTIDNIVQSGDIKTDEIAKGITGSVFTAAHLGYIATCYLTLANELCKLPTTSFSWGDTIDNGVAVASAADARALYWGIRGSSSLAGYLLGSAVSTPRVTDNEVSIIVNNIHRHHYFDLFKEWIVDPVGDIFIETLGQVWNRIADTETALKTGMSSGITRAFDAATGNAVWALYVNRGDPDNDPVMMRYITGLESGITVYHDDGKHLSPYVSASHRTTNRAISHAVIRCVDDNSNGEKILLFFDTPQPNKVRRAYVFRTTYDARAVLVTRYVGSTAAESILRTVQIPDSDFFGKEVVPDMYEELNTEAVIRWLDNGKDGGQI